MSIGSRRSAGRLLVAILLIGGTACSAQARTTRHLERADRYFDEKKYREAILEYRNVLEADATNVRAQQRLGIAHYELKELGEAYPHLQRASQLAPEDIEVRWRLGVLQALSGQPEEARRHAEFVLQKDGDNLDALGLLADTADPAELDAVITRVQAARERAREREKASRILGTLYVKKRDVAKAEDAFQDAVKAAPQSEEAHLSLGTLYLARGQVALAEKEYRAAAEAAPAGSAPLRLADFLIAQGRPHDARTVLTGLTAKQPDNAPAWLRLAEIAIVEKKFDEADQTLERILKANPRNTNAQLLRAQIRLAQRKTDEATQLIQRAIKDEPRFAPAHYQLALAHLQAGNEQQARAALRGAIDLAPSFVQPAVRLAELDLAANNPDGAIEDLNKLLAARPGVARAYELLGAAHMKKGDVASAAAAFDKLQQVLPARDPRAAYYRGVTLLAQGKRAEARAAFEQSLAAAPGAPDPLNQLVEMAFQDKRPDVALALARRQTQAAPRSAVAQHVLGLVHQRRGEIPQAEAAYRKAVEVDPALAPSHLELGKIYLATGRLDLSLATADKILAADARSADGWQLKGLAALQKGDVPGAQQAFKKALEINPRYPAAANNLAFLYSEHGGDPEQALQLAQTAREAAPEDPHVADTLGWILYRRGVYQRAVSLLKESASKLPDSAEVHFHLGMAQLKAGDKPAARQALSRALELNAGFKGADEARRALTEL